MPKPRKVVYRLSHYTLDDLSDEFVRCVTARDLMILMQIRYDCVDAQAVMQELRLQARWDGMHPGEYHASPVNAEEAVKILVSPVCR